MTTAAAIDRLVHHCVILELNIPSYRVEQAKKAKEESNGKILDFNQACRDGFTILHKRAAELLFRDLAVAHVDGSFGRQLTKLPRIDILVLDDFAVAPLKDGERRDFLELCDDRYQRRSMILTSQCRSPTGTNRSAIHARRQHPRPPGP